MNLKAKGITYAITGTMLWGMSGTVAQYIFTGYHVSPLWLVGVRLLSAGLLLLIWEFVTNGKQVFSVWRDRRNWMMLLIFAFLGMLPSQLTYFMAIKYGNAPTATVLQFLGPLFIIIYLTLMAKKLPRRIDVISIVIALVGTYLLVTNGHLTSLALAPIALFWGVLAGLSQASYTLLPRQLLTQFDAKAVVGWAMFLGGLPFTIMLGHQSMPNLDVTGGLWLLFIIVAGTMFAYLLYLQSIRYILPSVTGMLSAFEPLTATVLSILFLNTPMTVVELVGGLLILATVFLQALPTRN